MNTLICIYKHVSLCVCVCARMRLTLFVKVCSSAILLREQFLNVSLAPVGLNFLVLEDYGKNVRENLEVVTRANECKVERETERRSQKRERMAFWGFEEE